MQPKMLIAFPNAMSVTVSTGGFSGLSSLAGTPSRNDLMAIFTLYTGTQLISTKLSAKLCKQYVCPAHDFSTAATAPNHTSQTQQRLKPGAPRRT